MKRCAAPSIRAKSFQNLLDLMSSYTHTHTHTHTLPAGETEPFQRNNAGHSLVKGPQGWTHTHTHTDCALRHTQYLLSTVKRRRLKWWEGLKHLEMLHNYSLLPTSYWYNTFPHIHTQNNLSTVDSNCLRGFLWLKRDSVCLYVCVL